MIIQKEENFYEFSYQLFYEFAHAKPEQVGLILSKEIVYPLLEHGSRLKISIPLPRLINGKYAFEGLLFENTERGRISLWSLFLATAYHLASHAAVSSYSSYEEWKKGKDPGTSWQIIDFIEDIKVRKYISCASDEILQNIERIESEISQCMQEKKPAGEHLGKNPHYLREDMKKIDAVSERILASQGNNYDVARIADFLHSNQSLFAGAQELPCREHHKDRWFMKFEKNGPNLEPTGMFAEQARTMDKLWQVDEQSKARLFRTYQKCFKGLNFDRVVVPTGHLQNFEQIKSDNVSLLRRIRQQTLVLNLMDDSKICEIGHVDLQMAVQAIASEGVTTDIFENDELRRGDEAWVILIDTSASMRLRFEKIKEFLVCIAESANDLTGKHDAWALYGFNNNFQILKDFKERYTVEIQARIGDLQTGGLSLLPDAIEVALRVLAADPRDRKHIFVITDGHPAGYDKIHDAFSKTVKKAEIYGISLIAIGVSKTVTRVFKNSVRGSDLKRLVSKFISVYRSVSSDM